MSVKIHHGDCMEVMRGMADGSIDAVVTDPPYHLASIVKRFGGNNAAPAKSNGATGVYARSSSGFMKKSWDGGDIAFRPETWADTLRLLKPGGYLVAFASTRGYHRMACAIEDAGFIIHPMLGWIFGSGFPKAHKVELDGWEGWRYGLQSLKPALEPICLAQKPMEGTGTQNVAKYGTGAINIDGCRVGMDDADRERLTDWHGKYSGRDYAQNKIYGERADTGVSPPHAAGRWPANVCHDGSPEVLEAFAAFGERRSAGDYPSDSSTQNRIYGTRNGQQGHLYADTGTAARFFYCAKASREERDAGLEGLREVGAAEVTGRNTHPTVKPVALMQWLVRMITPPGGTVLDPFAGSGSTGIAAHREGFNAILIEREAEYVEIARRRLAGDSPLFSEVA